MRRPDMAISTAVPVIMHRQSTMEEDRTPVGRSDFKSGETRSTCLVGSTPTLFRQRLS